MSGTGNPVGQKEIRARLPHRFPMLLVDRVTEVVPGQRLTAVKAVTCNEPWYAALGPDTPPDGYAYPRTLLVESWCQAAGVLATWDEPNPDVLDGRVMLFGSMSKVGFGPAILPGDVVEHHVTVTRQFSDTVIVKGTSRAAGRTVMTVDQVVMTLRPATELRPGTPAAHT